MVVSVQYRNLLCKEMYGNRQFPSDAIYPSLLIISMSLRKKKHR